MAVHFVGFRKDQEYFQAVMVWGKPDFIHLVFDYRSRGDMDFDNDTIVIAQKSPIVPTGPYSDQDHERF